MSFEQAMPYGERPFGIQMRTEGVELSGKICPLVGELIGSSISSAFFTSNQVSPASQYCKYYVNDKYVLIIGIFCHAL